MAITFYSGLPGTGKTASSTYLGVKEYKKHNRLLYKFILILQTKNKEELKNIKTYLNIFKETKDITINKIYSNYPILLDKKKNIYSNTLQPNDLSMRYKFPKDSTLILDEFQRYFDSREFKKFPKQIGTFMQHHRHADITNIILIAQHPRRVDNKIRDLAEVFRKYRIFIKLPFIPIIFTTYTNYYEFEDYGLYNKVDKEHKTYDYDNHFKFYYTGNCFTRYNSKYFAIIFNTLPDVQDIRFKNKSLSLEELNNIGISID